MKQSKTKKTPGRRFFHRKMAAATTEAPVFEQFKQELSAESAAMVDAFMQDYARHCALPRPEKKRLRMDFEAAIVHYVSVGLPLRQALDRLAIENLGGFYARPPIVWYALDDAAKIYPLSMKHGQMSVFRLSATLKKPVVPALLQMALTFAIKRFPSFATSLKKGFFWHYLDATKRRYAVEPETDIPCRPLRVSRSAAQTFRVLYHDCRISVEYFHILTDGTGGMAFLKTLVAEYLRLLGISVHGDELLGSNDAPDYEETANEFSRADKTARTGGFLDKPATQMSGRLSKIKPCQILHFKLDAALLKQRANACGATVTVYLLSKLFLAGKSATDEREGDINIQVPVNMRKFYPSKTLRNFAMYCGVRLPISDIRDEGALLETIAAQLAQKASKEAMSEMMNSTLQLIGAIRWLPLAVKTPAARLVYGFLGDKIFSNTLSNLGVVSMPPALQAEIESMDFVLGTVQTNRACCTLVTFGNVANLSITKLTADPSFEEALYRLLADDGLLPVVEGSPLYAD